MKKINLSATIIILSVIFLSFISSAVEVVQVANPPEEKKGYFASMFSFMRNPIFWYIVVGFIIFVIIAVIIFFLVKWLVKYIKQRNDVFWRMREDRIVMAKVHRRYPSNHWWKIEKNTPVRLANKDEDGKLHISRPIGFHRGDCVTHEGNMIIWLNLTGKNKWFFFPESDLLILPNKAEVKVVQRNDKGDKVREEIFKLPVAKDIIQFNEGEILLFVEGLSKVGIFLIPVLKSKDGKIIDLAMPVYSTLKDVVMGDYLYEINSEFVSLSKKAMDLNPQIRAIQKTGDPNQNVQIEQTGN